MTTKKRISTGLLAAALVAGLVSTTPMAAFAEEPAVVETPQSDEPSPDLPPEDVVSPLPEHEESPAEDDTSVVEVEPTPDNVPSVDVADSSTTDTPTPLTPPAVGSFAVVAKCTIKVSLPTTAKSANYNDPISLTTNGVDCVDDFKLTIRRISDNRVLNSWWVSSGDEDYQNGRIDRKIPGFTSFSIPGKYKAEITDTSLDSNWARANGFNPYNDHPKVTFGNNVMDLRHSSKTTFAATRAVDGVAMRGTVTRYDNRNDRNIAQAKATVKLQKKQGGSWVTKKTVTTNGLGKFSATVADTTKADWRAQVQSSSVIWSTQRGTTVAKKSSGKAATKISRSYQYDYWNSVGTFSGTVKFNAGGGYYSAHKGVKIVVQRQEDKTWKSVKTVTTNSSGKYSFKTSKKSRYRFVVTGTKSYASQASAALTAR